MMDWDVEPPNWDPVVIDMIFADGFAGVTPPMPRYAAEYAVAGFRDFPYLGNRVIWALIVPWRPPR